MATTKTDCACGGSDWRRRHHRCHPRFHDDGHKWAATYCGDCGRSHLAVHGSLTPRIRPTSYAMKNWRAGVQAFLQDGRSRHEAREAEIRQWEVIMEVG